MCTLSQGTSGVAAPRSDQDTSPPIQLRLIHAAHPVVPRLLLFIYVSCAAYCLSCVVPTSRQTSGAPAGSDQDPAIPDGLDLYELADVLVDAGAVNAINLIGGAPSAMVVHGSAIADPAEACWSAADHGKRFIEPLKPRVNFFVFFYLTCIYMMRNRYKKKQRYECTAAG